MKTEDLMDAFQYLDDDLIESTDLIRNHPQLMKKGWSKKLATAACLCIIASVIYFSNGNPYAGKDGASDMEMQDNVHVEDNGNEITGSRGDSETVMLTLPDYGSFQKEAVKQNPVECYAFLAAETENMDDSANKDSLSFNESLTCTVDALPVYTDFQIHSSYMIFDDLGIFEKELAKMTSYEIYGHYFYIPLDSANALLQEGKYMTFTEDSPVFDENYKVRLVYLFDQKSDLAIPYYHFYKEIDENYDEGMMHLHGWFVPAIEEEYITNMPDNRKVVN